MSRSVYIGDLREFSISLKPTRMNQILLRFCRPVRLFVLLLSMVSTLSAIAQPATYSVPFGIGRNNCGLSGGTDSVYFFNYANAALSNNYSPRGCRPLLNTAFAPLSGYSAANKPFTIFNSSVSFNPRDQRMYYIWTDYNIASPYRSYIWRWDPTTCPAAALDTLTSFAFDIGGITFDNNGFAWQLEFSGSAPFKAYLRQLDFVADVIRTADTLDLLPGAGGIGDTLYNVGSGDITLTPDGQMYFIFDNKLYTPDYGSYNNPTRHLKCTYIDTVRRPGTGSLVGLGFADGDLIASYAGGCIYRRINPVTGDTAAITYTYPGSKGVRATDMSQINSGVGAAKRLVSVTPTGTAQQYNVVYDVYVKNYGNTTINNLQVTDDLSAINGVANVSNVTTAFVGTPPPGIALNPGFTGVGGGASLRLLRPTGQTLRNYPVDSSYFTIRISCRLSNIVNGTIYNNQVVTTANGFNNAALRDSSTNGNVPDLNANDKPDDFGESQPTPFLIALTPSVPPCATLSQLLYNQTFGTGVGLFNALPPVPTSGTTYGASIVQPLGTNRFAITDSAYRGDLANWVYQRDHTGDAAGRMMVVNADAAPGVFYRDTLAALCPNQQYSFSFWAAFIGNATQATVCDALGGTVYARIKCRVRDRATGLVITEASTPNITSRNWAQLGIKWIMPTGYSNVIFELINDAPGGCGNDLAIDDIQFGICYTAPVASTVTVSSGCVGGNTTFTASLGSAGDSAVIPGPKDFQWQESNDGISWTNIGGANGVSYVMDPLSLFAVGKYYRVIIAAQGNIGTPSCQYPSPGSRLLAQIPSLPAGSVSRSKNNVCPGESINLRLNGGLLGSGAAWRWYSGSCVGALIGSGTSITVTPAVTTTYYVRAEGNCGNTACVPVTITINCDIDDDDDGIPDVVENSMVDIEGDLDLDGTVNWRDTDYAGYVDANSDGVDDRYDNDLDGIINQYDRDSDNDGIPDVVEAYGVDANGDGVIDNYTDTDADGFSQNVDVNTSGHLSSGTGLSVPDLDGDGRPNYFDLDSDNDGIPDAVEANATDANNNGIPDWGTMADADADGFWDPLDGTAAALLRTGADGNNDGRADSYPNKNFEGDARANAYDPDSDGDGIVDVIEAGFPDTNLDGFVDAPYNSRGWATSIAGRFALGLRNTESVGNPDYLDIDSDGDGIPDNIEGQTTGGYRFPAYSDSDGDGLDNNYDNRPLAFSGTGIAVFDLDGDTTPDYRDLDTDGDGQIDIIEGNDFNLNRLPDDNVTPTGLDTDSDGLDNRFDSSNVGNIKGTSYMMGTSGSFTGDATPGSRTPVQRSFAFQTDRDWRFVGNTLPAEFLTFSGSLQGTTEQLYWSVITAKAIAYFEVERSTDNLTFQKVGTVNGTAKLNEAQDFRYADNIAGITNEIIYYRLKVVGVVGEVRFSHVLIVRRTKVNATVAIMPNPADAFVSMRIYAEKDADITIRLVDNTGRTVMLQQQRVLRGTNNVQLNGLDKFSDGFYSIQMVNNNEVIAEKLVIKH